MRDRGLGDGVRALSVTDGPVERRRQLVARRPGPVPAAVATVVRVLEEMHASPQR